MSDFISKIKRTHYCGRLKADDAGKEVVLMGWVHRRRDHGGTGAGFCYNVGRVVAAAGPFIVGAVAARGVDQAVQAISYVALVPLAGLLLVPFIIETRGRPLADLAAGRALL